MEQARRGDDAQVLIEDDQRLAYRGHDAVKTDTRRFNLSFGGSYHRNVGKCDQDALDAPSVASVSPHC
jgi:hypothetical protein